MQIKGKVKSCIKVPSLGILGLLAIAMICPVAPEEAQAADTPVSAGGDSLSVSISNNTIALEADPGVNSGMALGSVTVSAQTTNETGYTMKLSANNAALKSADTTNTATVPTLASSTTLTNFPANRWGYYFGTSEGIISTTYKPISTIAADIDSTAAANSTLRTRSLTIAARVDSSLPADTYSAQLTVSVVGNAPRDISAYLSTMQEMTSSICNSIPEGVEGQLEDTRDGQLYFVRKMKDGRCWMVQNLALGSASSTIRLSPASSSIANSWTLPRAYENLAADTSSPVVWNFSKWVLATPLATTACAPTVSGNPVYMSSCTKVGLVDVSDSTNFQSTYKATITKWEGANARDSTLVAVNCTAWSGSDTSKRCTAGTYDPRYLIGNYYTWYAATAGTGEDVVIAGRQASGSVCPRGWRLPTSGASGELGILTEGTSSIASSPLRAVRSGAVSQATSDRPATMAGIGRVGNYWSSTLIRSPGIAASLYFTDSTNIDPAASTAQGNGLSVRCVNDSSI